MQIETKKRSFIKAAVYRVIGTLVTTLLVFLITKNPELSVAVGVLDLFIKFIIYFIHDRIWQKINFGKKIKPGVIVWMTGLSGSGKSTLAKKLNEELLSKNKLSVWLDGDEIRKFFPQLGFSKAEREDHIKRVALMASVLEQQGNVVIVSLISPYLESRYFARGLSKNFHEIYLAADIEACKRRDIKGLYKKAEQGLIKNMTGIGDVYEVPVKPELTLPTGNESVDISFLKLKNYVRNLK